MSIAAWHTGIIGTWLVWGFVGDRTSEAEYVHEDEEGGFWEAAVSVPSSRFC